ncbi:nudix hydrolase 16, mitochondrial [Populus trichocarpa]|nr:nudix hydrolase 16, mitochondrial [Populus trichocarpa]|eukprot:XP_002323248.3 nudix hydrolase 16, mitochondrial [Populus trichocarpa]
MTELVARTGRQQQRYEAGCWLVAGCIPFKYRSFADNEDGKSEKVVEVLMINANSGPGLLFPKGGWETDETVEEAAAREALEEAGVRGDLLHFLGQYEFKSKTLQDKFSPEGLCKASMFALLVKEELQCWPEQNTRQRSWLTIPEAGECCRYKWMKDALEERFTKWLDDQMISRSKKANDVNSSASSPEEH